MTWSGFFGALAIAFAMLTLLGPWKEPDDASPALLAFLAVLVAYVFYRESSAGSWPSLFSQAAFYRFTAGSGVAIALLFRAGIWLLRWQKRRTRRSIEDRETARESIDSLNPPLEQKQKEVSDRLLAELNKDQQAEILSRVSLLGFNWQVQLSGLSVF